MEMKWVITILFSDHKIISYQISYRILYVMNPNASIDNPFIVSPEIKINFLPSIASNFPTINAPIMTANANIPKIYPYKLLSKPILSNSIGRNGTITE